MNRRSFIKKSAFLSTGLAISPWHMLRAETDPLLRYAQKSHLMTAKNLPEIVLEGHPRKRGRVHGETLRSKIVDLVQVWKEELSRGSGMDPDKYIEEFVNNTSFTPAINKWTPGLLEEVRGISEGSGVDFKTLYAFQLVDEEWWYARHKRYGMAIPEAKNCSALGVYNQKGLPPIIAQNMDIPAFYDGYQVLFQIKRSDGSLESLVYSLAGFIALAGLNNRGVGVVVNALLQLDHRVDGLPVAFIIRGILAQETHTNAVKFIKEVKHASGQNYTIGGPEKVTAYEGSANKVIPFLPYEEATRLYHTNHPLANDDQGIHKAMLENISPERRPKSPGNSEIRYKALEKRLKDPTKTITAEDVKSVLSSKDDPQNPVCREKRPDGRGGFTAGGLIMELSKSPLFHISPGPPCSTDFGVFKF